VAKKSKLAPMRVSDGFRAFILDQLAGIPLLRPQLMFGGIGLYSGDFFFGILAADVLYFKVDDSNLAAYEAARMKPFKPYPDRAMSMSYYQVPPHVIEDRDELEEWAKKAIRVSQRARKARSKK
jgi:DNA transformation protein